MAQTQSIEQSRDNPLNREGLCILSLDGGGVRGLSSLLIIKALMGKVNAERQKNGHPSVKPCQLFDMIGGTSTGGIIAIMLGRLEMDIDECIKTYTSMFQTLFASKGLPINILGKIKGRFDSAVFEKCIGKILRERGLSDAELLNDGKERCKVVVCATEFGTASTDLLRSYHSSDELNNTPVTICHAVQATSAASFFFDPVTIEPYGRRFVDGGLGANNPVEQLWNEAQRIWCEDERAELGEMLKCLVSIGTGNPGLKPISYGPWKFFSETLVGLVTETEKTAKLFIERHQRLYETKRYFRFNVQQGLQGIGLAEYKKDSLIASATVYYMNGQETRSAARECAMNLKQKQFHLEFSPQSILKWNSNNRFTCDGQKPITFIPFHRNDNLVNRDGAFMALDHLFSRPSYNGPIAIWGLGGCGKTQIALEYAYRRQEETSCSIFWVHADSEARFTNDYSDLGKIAGLLPDLKGEDLLRAVQQWMERQVNWLLILDNADDLTIFKTVHPAPKDRQVRCPELLQFVPMSQTGTVVWTSRDGGIVGSITGHTRGVEVGAMTVQESCELFRQLSGQDDIELSLNKEKLLELLELLERLPLAITQAATYIRKTKVSVQQYLKLFNESEARKSNLLRQEFQDIYRSEVPNSVMHTWLISMRQIAEESPCSGKILKTLAFFDNRGLPFDLIKAAAGYDVNEDEVRLFASRLTEYSFLQAHRAIDEESPSYEQHGLVQLAIRQSLSEMQTRSFSGDALRIISNLFPDVSYETWNTCRLYLPHALKAAAWEEAEDFIYRAPQLLQHIGTYYWEQGCSNEAEEVDVRLLKLLEKIPGTNHETIKAMGSLATVLDQQGRFKEAEELHNKVLQSQKVLGETHPHTMIAMISLASTLSQHGQLDKAEQLEKKVLDLRKEAHGERKVDRITITAMGNLASTWSQQGKLFAAEQLRSEVLELRKEVLGERHPDTINAMSNLATSWNQQGRLDEAEGLQTTVLELQKEILGKKHPHTITAMANLATTWNLQRRFDEAERLQIEVLELRKEVLREKHPNTILAMANLATIWHQQGRLDEAERQAVEVLKLKKEVLGEKHPDTITAMTNLAVTLEEQGGRAAEAEEYLIEVLKLQKEVLGDKHPYTITAMADLVVPYWQLGKLDEAKQLQFNVVKFRKEVLGDTHPDTIQAERGLALMNRELDHNNGEVGPQSIPPNASNSLDPVQRGTASEESYSPRKVWERKFMKWRKLGKS